MQQLVEEYHEHHRLSLKYGSGVPPIYLIFDAILTGVSGLVSQGEDWKTAPVAAFWSAKFNLAQQSYSVTDREVLAIIASLRKFQTMLHGTRFTILTDHRALKHLMRQKDVAPRQAQWLDDLSQFDFEIKYIEGTQKLSVDTLSRIYNNGSNGTVQAESGYVHEEQSDEERKYT